MLLFRPVNGHPRISLVRVSWCLSAPDCSSVAFLQQPEGAIEEVSRGSFHGRAHNPCACAWAHAHARNRA
eukprot:4942375-Alexandrium_andersonii.AAC.1